MEENNSIVASQLAAAISTQILELHILPTERCNFRCVYCYEDFSIGRMKPIIVNSIKKLIENRMQELKQLRISWFGGEPLAAKDIVFDISHYAKSQIEKYGCDYNFGITTNAYLLDLKCFEALIEAGVTSYQISLDGPEEVHNQSRVRADGAGTFQKIWTNLLAMAKTSHQFEVILRIHVTPENYFSIPILIDQIKENFKHDPRFSVFIKAIANLGGPHSGSFEVLTGKTKTEIIKQLNDMLGDEIMKHELHKQGLAYICYASAQNAWVIRADGTLAKCTVAFSDDRNRLGLIKPDGTFAFDQDKMQLWLRGLKSMDTVTLGCPAYQLPSLKTDKLSRIPVKVQ